MASGGYGRGGRGAALLQALSQPVRRPGEEKEDTPTTTSPPTSSTAVPMTTPAPMGRGLAMGRGAYMSSLLEAAKKTSSDTASVASRPGVSAAGSAVPAPAGRGVAALGRGVAAMSLGGRGIASMGTPASMSPAHSEASIGTKPPSPKGGGQGFSDDVNVINVAGKPAMVFKGTTGKPVHLGANSIHIKPGNAAIYQYAVHFHPQIDSRNMRYRLINEQRATIGPVKAFDGCILFLPKQLEHKQITIQSKKPTDGSPVAITITLTKMLSPGAEECMQVYNVIFRRMMACLKLVQINRNHYYPGGAVQVPQHKLEIWPGYCTAIAEQEGGLMLLTDVSHRVLRTQTVLDLMCDLQKKNRNFFRDNVIKAVQGCTVLTRYNNKTYRIDDIAWDQNPKCSFSSSATGESMTYQEYYLKNYNKKIFDDEQPLLIHRPKVSKQEQLKREPREGRPRAEVICLVPELCYLTGLTDEMRDDFRVMKDLAVHTRINPNQRNRSLRDFIKNVKQNEEANKHLEDWGLKLDTDTLHLEGRQLPPEDIYWRGGRTNGTVEADWGRDLNRQKVISAVDIVNWMVLSTQRDSPKANDFIKMMKKIGPSMGINIRDPHLIQLRDDRVETYLRSIKENLNNTVQCVVTIFPTKRDDRYSAVKKLCCVEQPVPSQGINTRTISCDERKLRSVVTKIALQMNCKMGGELWAVDMPTKNMMVIGIDVYHEGKGGKGKSVGGFVASMNPTVTRWYSRVCIQLPHQELIDGLKSCITAALKKYHEINHDLPARIMIFRDGVGDGQLARVADYEVQQITECFRLFGDYQPKLGVVVVQKRINTRIWSVMNQDLGNPPPGTIVDHTITRRDWYDFFLISQHVRQGTVSPTHYVVVHDSSGLQANNIQRLAYKLTHLYYNWPGTVRVPAPCQYAHKLAYLIGQNTHKEHNLELADRLFFL